MKFSLYSTSLEYPSDGRRKAEFVTTDENICTFLKKTDMEPAKIVVLTEKSVKQAIILAKAHLNPNFEEELRAWNNFMSRRGVGHTHACLVGVKNAPRSLLVCNNLCDAGRHDRAMSWHETDRLLGQGFPVVFDNFTISHLISKSLTERIDKQRVMEAIEKLIVPIPDSEGRIGRNLGLRQLQEELGLVYSIEKPYSLPTYGVGFLVGVWRKFIKKKISSHNKKRLGL